MLTTTESEITTIDEKWTFAVIRKLLLFLPIYSKMPSWFVLMLSLEYTILHCISYIAQRKYHTWIHFEQCTVPKCIQVAIWRIIIINNECAIRSFIVLQFSPRAYILNVPLYYIALKCIVLSLKLS